jgi:hypothetical protein
MLYMSREPILYTYYLRVRPKIDNPILYTNSMKERENYLLRIYLNQEKLMVKMNWLIKKWMDTRPSKCGCSGLSAKEVTERTMGKTLDIKLERTNEKAPVPIKKNDVKERLKARRILVQKIE